MLGVNCRGTLGTAVVGTGGGTSTGLGVIRICEMEGGCGAKPIGGALPAKKSNDPVDPYIIKS